MTSDILTEYGPEAIEDKWLIEHASPLCLSTRATVRASFALARYIGLRHIQGDVVECGVFAGGQVIAMHRGLQSAAALRSMHLFDSFQGIPHAGPHDTDNIDGTLFSHGQDGALVTSGISSCSEEAVRSHLTRCGVPLSETHFWPGWFQDTVPKAMHEIEKIALLRLDGDLYESTRACWPLLEKVEAGGIVIVDDYALAGCRKAILEYLALHDFHPEIAPIPEGLGPVFWVQPLTRN